MAKVQAAYLDGTLTAASCARITSRASRRNDHEGPAINSIICVNPKALEEADAFDAYVKESTTRCAARCTVSL